MSNIKNAVIKEAKIFIERGMLTAALYLDLGDSWTQAFGFHSLYLKQAGCNEKNYAGHFLFRVLEAAGTDKWDELKGKAVRVMGDDESVKAIGHIIEDIWFNPGEEFAGQEQALPAKAEN